MHTFEQLSQRAHSDDLSVAKSAISELQRSNDPNAEEPLWSVLIRGGYRKHACAALLERRGHHDVAVTMLDREQSGLAEIASWIHALVTLDDARLGAVLIKAVREAADFPGPPWSAVRRGLDSIVKLAGDAAVGPLSRFIREHPGQMRTLAMDALVALGPAAEPTMRELMKEDDNEVDVEATWGLFLLGDSGPLIEELETRGDVYAGHAAKLGERGLRMLCGPAVAARWEKDDCWYVVTHQMADEIAERGAKHKALLAELAAGGSELAAVALEKINRSSPK